MFGPAEATLVSIPAPRAVAVMVAASAVAPRRRRKLAVLVWRGWLPGVVVMLCVGVGDDVR
jgi:hypothetical protein